MFACGGTGGHIYPAIAVAENFIKNYGKKAKVVFVGNETGMEKDIVREKGYRFIGIDTRPLVRKKVYKNIANAYINIKTFFKVKKMLKKESPDCVLGTGGFVSFPVVYAAGMMKIKTIVHEPNMYPGLANSMLKKTAGTITLGFDETKKYFPPGKCVVTGNPFRESMLREDRKKAYLEYEFSAKRQTVLVMPGSRAAKRINEVILESIDLMKKELGDIQILWMCGKEEYSDILQSVKKHKKPPIRLKKFIKNAGSAYAIADAAVLRAGASTLTEIAAMKVPAVLVPYPFATGNHQEINAEVFKKRKVSFVIKDSELNPELLVKDLKKLLNKKRNASMRSRMKYIYTPDSARKITGIITGEEN